MNKIKLSADDVERLKLRTEFSDIYKKLNSLAGSNTASCYAVLKYSFYNVRNGRELLVKKNLNKLRNGKEVSNKNLNRYLNYATVNELSILILALKKMRKVTVYAQKNFLGYPYIYEKISKIGSNFRYDFLAKNGCYPEYYELASKNIETIKSYASKHNEINLRADRGNVSNNESTGHKKTEVNVEKEEGIRNDDVIREDNDYLKLKADLQKFDEQNMDSFSAKNKERHRIRGGDTPQNISKDLDDERNF